MANPLCSIDDCARMGLIDLQFPAEHSRIITRFEHRTLICEYHAAMALEFFGARGYSVPIEIKRRPSMPLVHSGGQRRYRKRHVIDNTE